MKLSDWELNISQILNTNNSPILITQSISRKKLYDSFIYVLSGHIFYTFAGKKYRIDKGGVIYIARNSAYDVSVSELGCTMIYIDFLFEDTGEPLQSEVFTPQNAAAMENLFVKLNSLWTFGSFSDKIYCKALIYQIYSELVSQTQYVPNINRAKIQLAVAAIMENYQDANFSVETLGPLCKMSQGHFRRIFYQIYRTTPVSFLISLRLNKGKELLTYSRLSIAEIAAKCGFSSTYYFSKKFKQATNMTPSEYRNTY